MNIAGAATAVRGWSSSDQKAFHSCRKFILWFKLHQYAGLYIRSFPGLVAAFDTVDRVIEITCLSSFSGFIALF